MEEKEIKESETTTVQDYASMLADVKSGYEAKLAKMDAEHKAEVKKMTDLVVNGQKPAPVTPEKVEDLPTRKDCYLKYKKNEATTNLEYWKTQLELRDATIREYGRDPWVTGSFGTLAPGMTLPDNPTEPEAMKRMADTIKAIIEESDGDPAKFNFLLSSAVAR